MPGYFLVLFIQYAGAYVTGLSVCPIICFFLGSCLMIKAFAEDILNDFIDFNVNKSSKGSPILLSKQTLYNVIQNVSDIKQLSKLFLFPLERI